MKKDLFFLASEECEGRGPEDRGHQQGGRLHRRPFKAAGLKPADAGRLVLPAVRHQGDVLEAGPHKLDAGRPGRQDRRARVRRRGSRVSGLSGKGTVGGGLVFAGYGVTSDEVRRLQGPRRHEQGRDRPPPDAAVGAKTDQRFDTTGRGRASTPPLSAQDRADAGNTRRPAVIFVNDRDMAGKDDPLMPFEYATDGRPVGHASPCVHVQRDRDRPVLLTAAGKSLADIEGADRQGPEAAELRRTGWTANARRPSAAGRAARSRTSSACWRAPGRSRTRRSSSAPTTTTSATASVGSLGAAAAHGKIHYGADDNALRHHGPDGTRPPVRGDAGPRRAGGWCSSLSPARSAACSARIALLRASRRSRSKDTVAMINMDMVGRVPARTRRTDKDRLVIGGARLGQGVREAGRRR